MSYDHCVQIQRKKKAAEEFNKFEHAKRDWTKPLKRGVRIGFCSSYFGFSKMCSRGNFALWNYPLGPVGQFRTCLDTLTAFLSERAWGQIPQQWNSCLSGGEDRPLSKHSLISFGLLPSTKELCWTLNWFFFNDPRWILRTLAYFEDIKGRGHQVRRRPQVPVEEQGMQNEDFGKVARKDRATSSTQGGKSKYSSHHNGKTMLLPGYGIKAKCSNAEINCND